MTSLPLACPAAEPLHPPGHGPSVLCGVMIAANRGAHVDGWTERGQVSSFISGQRSPKQIAYCAGSSVPADRPGERGIPADRCRYQQCRFWRAEKHRIWAKRKAGMDGLKSESAKRRPTGPTPDELAELGLLPMAAAA